MSESEGTDPGISKVAKDFMEALVLEKKLEEEERKFLLNFHSFSRIYLIQIFFPTYLR